MFIFFICLILISLCLSIHTLGVLEVTRMDCNIAYQLGKGYKPLHLDIKDLPYPIVVLLTDSPLNNTLCSINPSSYNSLCDDSMRYCKGI